MSTEHQQQASRENGARSHGATTPEGKLASSRNALKHGMLSETIVLACESTDRFRELVDELHEEFQPQTPFEETLIENMAVARWRLMRIRGMETAGMDYEMRRQAEMSDLNEDSATRASLAFRTLADDSRSLELINRYEARYDRQYYRAHRCFIETRDRRTPPSAQLPPEPVVLQSVPPALPQDEPEKVILPNEPTKQGREPVVPQTEAFSEKSNLNERTQEVSRLGIAGAIDTNGAQAPVSCPAASPMRDNFHYEPNFRLETHCPPSSE